MSITANYKQSVLKEKMCHPQFMPQLFHFPNTAKSRISNKKINPFEKPEGTHLGCNFSCNLSDLPNTMMSALNFAVQNVHSIRWWTTLELRLTERLVPTFYLYL